MPITNCLVDGCESVGQRFRPPRSPFLKQIWRKLLSGHCLKLKDKSDLTFEQCKVCPLHFEKKYLLEFTNNKRLRLAYPTLFSPEEIASGVSALGEFLTSRLEKINKVNEDDCDGKVHIDHSYSLEQRACYRTDLELIAELSDYVEKRDAGQPNKDSEGQENSNTTSNDNIENEEQSQIISKRPEVQTCRKNSADKSNSNSFSTVDSEKQDGSQINSKRRTHADRIKSITNSNKPNSATATERYTYSFNLTSDNFIDVIRTESNITASEDISAPENVTAPEDVTASEDITAPEAQTCITDDKEYRFDGDYFDDGLPTIEEPEPEAPEAVFSWQTELNLFPLDDVVNLVDDVLGLEEDAARAQARRARPAPELYDPAAPEEALDAEYQCNECQKEITGFRYTCVQCADWDLCSACEARGEHVAHYLLRIPSPRPYNEIQTVLAAIRQQLLSENLFLRPEFADIDWPPEVKEEDLGEDSAPALSRCSPDHTSSEESSDESDGSASPRRKRARREAPPTRAHTEDLHLTDDLLHISPENEQIFTPELSLANPPASVPVASTEIPSDLITSILTSRNASEVRPYGNFKSLAKRKTYPGNSVLKPIQTEIIPEDPLSTDCIERLVSNSPKGVSDNLTNQQCDDNIPTIIIEDDTVQNSVVQRIQQPTLPVNVLRTKTVKMIPYDLPVIARPVGSIQNPVVQPIQQPTLPVNVLRTKTVKMIPHDLPVGSIQNPVVQRIQQTTLPVNVLRTEAVKMIPHDLPVIARPVGSIQNPVVQPIQQPILPVNDLRTKAVKVFPHDLPASIKPVGSILNPVVQRIQQTARPVNVLRTEAVKMIPHDLPVIARPVGSIQNPVVQPIQQPILPVNDLRTKAVKVFPHDLPASIKPVGSILNPVVQRIQQTARPVNVLRTEAVKMIPHDLPVIARPVGSIQNPVLQPIQRTARPVNILRKKSVKMIPHDLPASVKPVESILNPVLQPIQQTTLPVHVLRTEAVKMIPHDLPASARPVGSHRITRAQFFNKDFDDNLPAIILEDDEDDQPADRDPQKSLQQPNDPLTKQLAHNSPSRMDTDSSPIDQRVTRSKRKIEKVTVLDSPVPKSGKNVQKDERLLQTIGGAIQTIDQLVHLDDVVDITEEVPDTSRLTAGPETVVLRVPPGTNDAALMQALQSTAIVLLEPLKYVIQRVTPPKKRLK